jgi:hypothetical protein
MNGWFTRLIMSYRSFTVHLPNAEVAKLAQMKEDNPDFSRNALIKLAIMSYGSTKDADKEDMMHRINALHKQLNPDWKRKKSLPYHFASEYAPVKNYTDYHGSAKHE